MKFHFKNYTNLSKKDKLNILKIRNLQYVRENMYTSDIIKTEDHLKWIEGLKTRKDCIYWAIFVDNNLVGAIDLTDISLRGDFAEWGFYIENKYSGYGALVEYLGMKHFLDEMGFEKILAGVYEGNEQVYNMHKTKFNYVDAPEFSIEKDGKKFNTLILTKENWNLKKNSIEKLLNRFYNVEDVVWDSPYGISNKRMKITILTDKTSWMNKYDLILAQEFKKLGHSVKIVHSKNKLVKGDIALFLSCFEIVGEEYLRLNKNNIVVHASDLPKGKGWSPTSWQILEGKNEIPLTLFEAVKEMDAGDYYIKDKVVLNGTELIDDWQEKLGKKIIEMCLTFVKSYPNIKGTPQSGKGFVYPKRKPQDSELDINKTIAEQFNLLRVVDNEKYPAFFYYKDKKYSLKINIEN